MLAFRTHWSQRQLKLFSNVLKLLKNDRLARLTYEGNPSVPIMRKIQLNVTARSIRHAFASVNWVILLISWYCVYSTHIYNIRLIFVKLNK